MTPEMQKVLDTFLSYYEQHRVAPTFRELAALVGNKGVSGVHSQVKALIKRGHLVRLPGADRSLAPNGPDLRAVPTGELRAELSRRENAHG
ncbi:MAG TPA: hypothetical protein VF463_08580 [Sphingobium sp.]